MMRQLLGVAGFDLRYRFRRISTWLYFGIFLALGFVLMMAAGGAWEAFDLGGGGRLATSPSAVTQTLLGLMLLALPITAALFGNATHRDFQTGIHPLIFTTPVSKAAYLGGRFTGALIANLCILLGAGLGLVIASQMPSLNPERVGPFLPAAYLQTYAFLVLPNLLFTGGLFFALAALTRQMLPNYIGGVAILMGYSLAMDTLNDLDDRRVAALLDPFGMAAVGLTTRYWTVAEQNARFLPFGDHVASNRLLWLTLTALVLGVLFWRFRFAHEVAGRRRRKAEPGLAREEQRVRGVRLQDLPVAVRSFGFRAQLVQYLSTTRRQFGGIVHSVYFAALAAVGMIFAVFGATQVGEIYGTTTHPVTYLVLEAVSGGFGLFMLIILTFYAGELVWAERDLRTSQLHDATPVATWVPFAAKLTALIGVAAVLQAVLAFVGLMTQIAHGYYRFELDQYATELFGIQLATYALYAVLAMAVHVVVNHKYMGHLIIILYYVAFPILAYRMGWEHNLYWYGEGGETVYSDMNGYGHSLISWSWFTLYWAAAALLLAILTSLLWVRGTETSTAWRLHLMRMRTSRPVRALASLACLGFIGLGGFVYYNTSVLNEYRSSRSQEHFAAEYEKRYGRFERIPQPRVAAVDVHVEIFPYGRDVRAHGVYRLVNRSGVPIDSIHLDYPYNAVHRFRFSRLAEIVLEDDAYGYHIHRLATPLAPGDSVDLFWEMSFQSQGFGNSLETRPAVYNGTFFDSELFPAIGYRGDGELTDSDKRRKHGLPAKDLMPPPDDPAGRMTPYISSDADWIRFAATVGTSPDQIALAPGYLRREWVENGRRYFRYEMDSPILNFYSFLSARYVVRKDRWKDVAIEIYHHPGHEYNLDRMIHAAKQALDYYTSNYGPYPHRQLRIVEFPRYEPFAQSFPNTVPFSEGIGFIARVDEDDVDYVFHVTAHEVAHQWWGHQVVAGNTQGATLTSESLSEFSALMVMEKEYGAEGVKKFLRHELEGYLTGRASERRKEAPLVRMTADQTYLHYNKGALALYALRDHIGEERVNAALREYLNAVRHKGPPYSNSLELISHLRARTPDSLQYVIDDWFEHITLYENRVTRAQASRRSDGRYRVELQVEARKVRADSLGNETEVPVADWVDIGVFAAPEPGSTERLGDPLYLGKHKLGTGNQTVEVVVDSVPERAGIDPLHRLVDRDMRDNTVSVRR